MLNNLLKVTPVRYQNILRLSALLFVSIVSSYLFPFVINKYLGSEVVFNIFNIIPIHAWILLIISSVISIALLRALVICVVAKLNLSDSYLPIFIKILEIGFICIPVVIGIILIVTNNKVVTKLGLNQSVSMDLSMNIGWSLLLILVLIWIIGLGFTIKSFLQIRMRSIKAFAVNAISSLIAGIVVGSITFINVNISSYEMAFANQALTLKHKYGLITRDQLDCLMQQYKEKARNK